MTLASPVTENSLFRIRIGNQNFEFVDKVLLLSFVQAV